MNITFIAPPAAGKGTQSRKVCEKYGLVHISIGNLLRNVNNEEIQYKVNTGDFVEDDVICKLLETRISKEDCNKGYVLDGFPRNLSQAKLYEKMLKKLKKDIGIIIVLDIDKQEALNRITGRQICPNCQTVYNDLFIETKSNIKGICDICNSELIRRNDDDKIVFEKRYKTYIEQTVPVIDYFNDLVYHVNSDNNADYTFKQIQEIIGGVYDKY